MTDESFPPDAASPGNAEGPAFNDMRALLIVSGIFILLAALSCLGLGGFYAFGMKAVMSAGSGAAGYPLGLSLSMGLMFAGMAGGMAWLAVGSMRSRKWARDILYAGGWLIAVVVGLGVISALFVIPGYMKAFNASMSASGPRSAPAGIPMGAIMAVSMILGIGMYLVPAVYLIIVYGLRNVRLTVKYRDPKPRWTDRMPLPVLAFWLGLVWASLTVAAMTPAYAGGLAVTGIVPNTAVGGAIILAISAVCGGLAWNVTRLTRNSWWILLGVLGVGMVSWLLLYSQLDMAKLMTEMNQAMALPKEQMEAQAKLNESLYGNKVIMLLPSGIFQVILLGFVVWLRRYFPPVGETPA